MLDDPIAYFITWTTYGTWLPGDDRWWVEAGHGHQKPDYERYKVAQTQMKESAFYLSPPQRIIVEETITRHCEIRRWRLWVANCRTNHVHVVVSAQEHPDTIVTQFKAWCTRHLKQRGSQSGTRERWWTEGASTRYLNDEESLEEAIIYVRDCQ